MGGIGVLRAAVSDARAGRGRALLASGPAGIGKSLLIEAAASLARGNLLPLIARGAELERELPFGGVLQLLEAPVRRAPDLLTGSAGAARRLFSLAEDLRVEESADQQLLIHSVYRLVAELADRRALALLVDDAHQLDAPSLRFLAYLARRICDLPVVLVIAMRTSAPATDMHLLGELSRTPGALRVQPQLAELARLQAAVGDPAGVATFSAAIAAADTKQERARLLLGLARAHQDQARFADASRAAAEGLSLDFGDERLRTELAAAYDTAAIWTRKRGGDSSVAAVAGVAPAEGEEDDPIAQARERLFAGRDHILAADLARRVWAGGEVLTQGVTDDSTAIRLFAVLHNADAEREALQIADSCLTAARRAGSRMDTATWRHMRGHALAYAGRLDEAETELGAAFAASADGWSAWLPVNASALAYVLIEREDLAGADAVIAAADAFTAHPRESPMWAMTDAARGRLALVRGEHERALEILEGAGRRMREELQIVNPACSPWRSDVVLALAALDRREEALALGEEDLRLARSWGAPRALGGALRVRGLIGSAQERVDWMARAVQALEGSETRLDHAYALHALGAAQREAGIDSARETLRLALDLAEQCGGRALGRRALAELHAAGGRPRRPRLKGPESLTEREADIAELAHSGLTNREIAEHLVVTPRVVAFHLGNVYRKLGISGRRELPDVLQAPLE